MTTTAETRFANTNTATGDLTQIGDEWTKMQADNPKKQRTIACRPNEDFAVAVPLDGLNMANVLEEAGAVWCKDDPRGFAQLANTQIDGFFDHTGKYMRLMPIFGDMDTRAKNSDGIFTADGSFSLTIDGQPWTFLSKFSNASRIHEVEYHREFFERLGQANRKIVQMPYHFEGNGDFVPALAYGVCFGGYTPTPGAENAASGRSDKRAHEFFQQQTGIPTHSILLQKPLYHLDTNVHFFNDGKIAVRRAGIDQTRLPQIKKEFRRVAIQEINMPEIFVKAIMDHKEFDSMLVNAGLPEESYQMLLDQTVRRAKLDIGTHIIEIDPWDAIFLGANMRNLGGNNVVGGKTSRKLQDQITSAGFTLKQLNLSTTTALGGQGHCMSNPFDEHLITGGTLELHR